MSTSPALTNWQHQVVAYIACGLSNADIGRQMGLSEITVKSHARALYLKLGARDRAHAVALAYQRGLLDGHRRDPVAVPTVVAPPCAADDAAHPRPVGPISASLDEVAAFARAVGYVLRTERQRRRWTLAQTGEQVGLSVSVLCRVELGVRPLDMSRLVALCVVLGVAPARVIATAQAEAFPLGLAAQRRDDPDVATNRDDHRDASGPAVAGIR